MGKKESIKRDTPRATNMTHVKARMSSVYDTEPVALRTSRLYNSPIVRAAMKGRPQEAWLHRGELDFSSFLLLYASSFNYQTREKYCKKKMEYNE